MDDDYTNSGFNKFLSRGDTQSLQGNLDVEGANKAVPFDRTQTSGGLGDVLKIGNIFLDGVSGEISVVDDNNNKRLIIGQQSDGTQGITVSKEGNDANINRPASLVFNSKQNVFKIAQSDTIVFPALLDLPVSTSSQQSRTIPHGLGYIPAYSTFALTANPGNALQSSFPALYYTQFGSTITFGDTVSTQVSNSLSVGVDAQNIYIARQAFNGDGSNTHSSGTVTMRYYILQETAN